MFTKILPALLLLILAGLLAFVLRNPPTQLVDVGGVGDSRFVGGFFTPEIGEGASFRWSGPSARLVLHGASAGPQLISLRMSGERLVALGAPELRIEQSDAPTTRFDLRPGWRIYHVLVPPGSSSSWGQAAPLELRSALERPGSAEGDERRIGVPLDWLALTPLADITRYSAEPLARGLRLAWLVAVLAGLYSWAEAQVMPQRHASAWARASLLIALLGAGLLLAAWRAPYLLAYALPPTPWLLGLLSLALGGWWVLDGRRWTADGGAAAQASGQEPAVDIPSTGPRPPSFTPLLGLALLVVANGLLNTQRAVGLGIGLALAGLLILAWAGLGAQAWEAAGPDLGQRGALIGLGLVLLVALAMRLYRIDSLPFGLWRDEARHGLFALRIVDNPDYRPTYIAAERVNMPALGLYPFALALWAGGVGLSTMRVVTALAGALTVLPLYGLVRRLSGRSDLALLSAALLAISSWHTTISRFSFPTIFDPLLTLSGLWLLTLALDGRRGTGDGRRWTVDGESASDHHLPSSVQRLIAGFAAGACLGLAVQTYHTGRVAPVLGAGLALLLLIRNRRRWRTWLAGVAAAGLGLGLVIWPLASYALSQPAAFNDRVGDVFLLSEKSLRGLAPLAVLDEAARRHLLMFNVQGDINGRHHAPYRPLLDYVTGIGLLAGAAALLRRLGDWRSLFVFGGLALGLAPSALAVDAPHAMRSLDACAFACIIAALGWAEIWRLLRGKMVHIEQKVASVKSSPRVASRWPLAASFWPSLLVLALGLNAAVYFVIMPPDREVWLSFYPVQSHMGAYVREVATREGAPALDQLFVPAELGDDPVYSFVSHGLQAQSYVGSVTSVPARPGALLLVGGYFYRQEAAALAPLIGPAPEPVAVGPPFPDGSGPSFVVYRVR